MLVHLPTLPTILIDIAAWLVIHLGISYFMSRISRDRFFTYSWLYQKRAWEKNGYIYEKYFKVKSWKKWLPDGAVIFKNGFEKKKLKRFENKYFKIFSKETCRAESTHWIAMFFSLIFFIWNLWWVGIIMIVYAITVNLPCIIAQRYNRIRLNRIIGKRKSNISLCKVN
jgi:glycosyl-4,4'-diaponeurosporenoate acyltransferase